MGEQQRAWEEPQMNLLIPLCLLWALQATLQKHSQETRHPTSPEPPLSEQQDQSC